MSDKKLHMWNNADNVLCLQTLSIFEAMQKLELMEIRSIPDFPNLHDGETQSIKKCNPMKTTSQLDKKKKKKKRLT